jgi:hypothetical protein
LAIVAFSAFFAAFFAFVLASRSIAFGDFLAAASASLRSARSASHLILPIGTPDCSKRYSTCHSVNVFRFFPLGFFPIH